MGRIRLGGLGLTFRDESAIPPLETGVVDGLVELTDIIMPLEPGEEAPAPVRLKVGLTVPGIAERLTVEGSVHPGPRKPSFDLVLRGQGLTPRGGSPFLENAGIISEIDDGRLDMRLDGRLALEPSGITGELRVADLALRDGDTALLAMERLSVKGLSLVGGMTRVGEVSLKTFTARVLREGDGSLVAAGYRLPAATPSEGTEPEGESALLEPTLDVMVKDLVLDDEDAPPTRIRLSLAVPGSLSALSLEGTVEGLPAEPRFEMALRGEGLKPGPLDAFFPPGMTLDVQDGAFSANLSGALLKHGKGGQSLYTNLTDVALLDLAEDDAPPRVKVDRIAARVNRLDPAGHVVDVEEVAFTGLALDVEKTADGALRVAGLSIAPPPPMENDEASLVGREVGASEAPKTPEAKSENGAPLGSTLLWQPGQRLPRVTVEKLLVNLERFSFIDRGREGAERLTLAPLTLTNPKPLCLLDEEPDELPAQVLELSLAVNPLVNSLTARIEATPFAPQPGLNLALDVTGLDAAALTRVLPDLAEKLDGRGLTDGRFTARLDVHLDPDRRDPLDFDLSGGFGLEASLHDVALRNGDEGPVLLGLKALHVDVDRMDPASGDVTVSLVEVVKPQGRVLKDAEGMHVAGIVLKSPPEAESADETKLGQGETVKETAASGSNASTPGGPSIGRPVADEPQPPGPEIKVDLIYLSDIDFTFTDATAEQSMPVPLTGLDVEVKRFTTRAFTESLPVNFSVLIESGEVPLTHKVGGLMGFLSSKAPEIEDRDFFEEISVNGKLQFHPRLEGWVKAGVSALELENLKGPASASGVTLDAGLLDAGAEVIFREDGSMDTRAKVTLTDLSLSEPADGPISRILQLPAPLDSVVFLLRDEDGIIEIPIQFHLAADGVSGGNIAATALRTLTTLIANAVAASPFRVAGTVTGLIPLGGEEEDPLAAKGGITLDFAPGDGLLTLDERAKVLPLVERMLEDPTQMLTLRQELGREDLVRVSGWANPSTEDCQELLSRLRTRRSEGLAAREDAAARAPGGVGHGAHERSQGRA